tara:strand:- start:3 stop:404 length:402 start_codon:yes stop_codon:yes gene_type:complete
MKIRILNLIIILALGLFMNCNDDDNNPSELNIRVSNISQFDFQSIDFNASTENVAVEMNIANLNSGQMSEYKRFEIAESIPSVELEIEGVIFTLIPYATGQETPIENGNYTYEINANDSQDQYNRLSFSLVKD